MIEAEYNSDWLTYRYLVKMSCEQDSLDLALQIRKEMRVRGCDLDLATSTMIVDLLCKMHRLEEALSELGDMIQRGIVPQFLMFRK